MIRQVRELPGAPKFKRLDFCKGEVRNKVLRATTLEELDNIFESDGVSE